jgi:hypothetical protein
VEQGEEDAGGAFDQAEEGDLIGGHRVSREVVWAARREFLALLEMAQNAGFF